ncbi:MAG: transposase [Polyangiaceae bacterium]
MTQRRRFWEQLVSEIESGARVRDVARRHHVNEGTLKWYRSQIRKERAAEPRLLQVVAHEPVSQAPLVIAIDGIRLELPRGVDVRYVAALIAAIRAC